MWHVISQGFVCFVLSAFISTAYSAEKKGGGFLDFIKKKKENVEKKEDSIKPEVAVEKGVEKKNKIKNHDPKIVDEAHVLKEKDASEALRETPSHDQSTSKIKLKIEDDCFQISFQNEPGSVIKCSEPLAIEYLMSACKSKAETENGKAQAMVTCEDKARIGIRFKSSKNLVYTRIRVLREANGREGTKAKYFAESAIYESSPIEKLVSEPMIIQKEEKKPDESPVQFKFSGYSALEWEGIRSFGYNSPASGTSQISLPNFRSDYWGKLYQNPNFFANFNVDVTKDRTSLNSIFQISEIYFGDTTSGGLSAQKPASIFRVRDMSVTHALTDKVALKGGIINTFADTRSFIFNDHIASVHLTYKTDFSEGYFWYGVANKNRPGFTYAKDYMFGINGTLPQIGLVKSTLYGVYRTTLDTLGVESPAGSGTYVSKTSDSFYYWLGGTFDIASEAPLNGQFTMIGNWGKWTAPNVSADKLNSYLLDGKVNYIWAAPQVSFTLEGLITPGQANVTDSTTGLKIVGRRKGFSSIIGASYLMTVATNDGLDDAPGSLKQSTIGSLAQEQGIQVGVFTTSVNFTKKLNVFGRYGHLRSAQKDTNQSSKLMGNEVDLGSVYQLTPSTTLQLDYGQFFPGAFFNHKSAAILGAAKIKFVF